MARLQLWEIHEQPWCPAAVREGATDCLNAIATWGRQFEYIVPILSHALQQTNSQRVIDLGSGSGGAWLSLYSRMGSARMDQSAVQPLEIVLTDLYPNLPAMQRAAIRSRQQITFVATPVDATQLDESLVGFRTLFTAFHHFSPPVARAILQDAVNQQQGIAIFEQTSRRPLALVVMLILPVIALLVVPLIRPLRLSRFFWTYIVPAIPLILCIDGIVSCLRTYSAVEMRALITELQGPAYVWKVGHVPSPLSPIGVHYTIGYPAVHADSAAAPSISPRVDAIK